jgi:hypothetical protein
VVRAKEAIEAENAEIKRRLATIITMLQPIVGTGKLRPSLLCNTRLHLSEKF